nr:MAG TPA: hypothetical protein [Caudoviricetes sp.]
MVTDNFTKTVAIVGTVFSPVMRWLVMKRDEELPWVVRLARWVGLAFAVSYGALLLAEKFKEVFL